MIPEDELKKLVKNGTFLMAFLGENFSKRCGIFREVEKKKISAAFAPEFPQRQVPQILAFRQRPEQWKNSQGIFDAFQMPHIGPMGFATWLINEEKYNMD
jgi:hypothetical protein